jgi:hypothetical protein
MRIRYYEGKDLSLAQVTKITQSGSVLICQLAAVDETGVPQRVVRPFPDAETCEDFFMQVVCNTPEDGILYLEDTNFQPKLGAMFDELDALYED